MIVLDESIPKPQRELLERWRINVNNVGVNIGRNGLLDEEIIRLLHSQTHSTFVTRDGIFITATFVTSGTVLSIYASRNRKRLCFSAACCGIPISGHRKSGWEKSLASRIPKSHSGNGISREKNILGGNEFRSAHRGHSILPFIRTSRRIQAASARKRLLNETNNIELASPSSQGEMVRSGR